MLHYILIMHSTSGLPIYERKVSPEFMDLKSEILSGLITALQQVSQYLKIGDLSTFNTHNYKVVIKSTENLRVTLLINLDDNEEEWKVVAEELATTLEQKVDFSNWRGELKKTIFNFDTYIDEVLSRFSWNITKIPIKQVEELELFGFMIVDKESRNVYTCNIEDTWKPSELIFKSESLLKEAKDAKIESKDYVLHFIKRNGRYCVIAFPTYVSQFEVERYIKTLDFATLHLYHMLQLKENMRDMAITAIGTDAVNRIVKYSNLRVIDILTTVEHPLETIEDFRRAWIRALLQVHAGGENH